MVSQELNEGTKLKHELFEKRTVCEKYLQNISMVKEASLPTLQKQGSFRNLGSNSSTN